MGGWLAGWVAWFVGCASALLWHFIVGVLLGGPLLRQESPPPAPRHAHQLNVTCSHGRKQCQKAVPVLHRSRARALAAPAEKTNQKRQRQG